MTHKEFMIEACNEAIAGMRNNHGGPFGAIIVKNDKIIGRGHNMVTSTNDPTAHAEIVAIRDACKRTEQFHLEDAVIYTSCEPCPMCLAAIYWANIKTVFYSSDRVDAEKIGFDDKFIYDELNLPIEKRSLIMNKLPISLAKIIFDEWMMKQDKKEY